jgi:three-Cys-motif partner protein
VIAPDAYAGREQAFVKHEVLRRYLRRLAIKIGQFRRGTTLNYVDGFSGPWDSVSNRDADSSPAIAMQELTAARDDLAKLRRPTELTVRCMFVEKDPSAFTRLERLCDSFGVATRAIPGEFESHISEAVVFARHGPNPFAFVFIDPTGWKGFGLRRIAPLLRVEPSEVLINFMLKDVLRFIDDEDSTAQASFEDLFGQKAALYRAEWRGLAGLEREDAIVATYCRRVADVGRFTHCASTIVVNPTRDRTHYHLVFGSRSRKGLITFREIERAVIPEQQHARARAKQRTAEARSGQMHLLEPASTDTDYFASLVARYRRQSRAAVEEVLTRASDGVTYEQLVDTALSWPLTSERELKDWLSDLRSEGRVEYLGLPPRARVPQVGKKHLVRWLR